MVTAYWSRARERAWGETRRAFRWEDTERVVIQVSVAAVALVFIWVIGGEESTKTIIARLVATAAIIGVVPVVFLSKLLAVPAVMEADMKAELDLLRIPEGGPQPDWPVRELFEYLRPEGADSRTSSWYEKVGRDILDKVGTCHLTLWGRERSGHEDEWSSLSLIAQSHLRGGQFTHWFLMDDRDGAPHYRVSNVLGPNREFGDLRVNRAEAHRLWPRGGSAQ